MKKYAQTLQEIDRLLGGARGQTREFLRELRRAFIGLDEGRGDLNEILAIANSWGESITHREAMTYLRAINEHGSMWNAPDIRLADITPPVRYHARPSEIIRISQAGRSMCAILGRDLSDGEAEFVPIESPHGPQERQRAGIMALHALMTRTRCGRRPVVWI